MPTAFERVEQFWAAADVTAATDKLLGVARYVDGLPGVSCVEWLEAQAHHEAKNIGPGEHPLDPHIAAELDHSMRLYQPYPADHWPGLDRIPEARWRRAVVLTLKAVRCAAVRPSQAGELAAHIARELESHHRDAAVQRVWHLCRMAGLGI